MLALADGWDRLQAIIQGNRIRNGTHHLGDKELAKIFGVSLEVAILHCLSHDPIIHES